MCNGSKCQMALNAAGCGRGCTRSQDGMATPALERVVRIGRDQRDGSGHQMPMAQYLWMVNEFAVKHLQAGGRAGAGEREVGTWNR